MSKLWTPPASSFVLIHGAGVAAGFSPPDSSSIYFGRWNIFDPSTAYTTHSVKVRKPLKLIAVDCLVIIAGLSGNAANTVDLKIRVNNTTSTSIGTAVAWNNPAATYTATPDTGFAGVDLAKDDDYVFEFATPSWVTQNPTTCFVSLIATYLRAGA